MAVLSNSGMKQLVSWAVQPLVSTAVTIYVLMPHIKCAFTHVLLSVSRPCFLLNHLTNRHVEKPLESTAKLVSTAVNGTLPRHYCIQRVHPSTSSAKLELSTWLYSPPSCIPFL